MDYASIAKRRLANEHLLGTSISSAVQTVAWLGAVQSQDYGGAKWGLGQRMTPGTTEAELDILFDGGALLRTHVMRPTWHFVLPDDIRWMLDLTGARVQRQNAGRYRELGLDAATLRKATRAIEKAVAGVNPLTRTELAQRMERAGISSEGQRMPYLLMYAELERVICSGPRRGERHTYTLLDERVPATRPLGSEEALALLANRYFGSHGPATPDDFAWWSGLTVSDARKGVALNDGKLSGEDLDGRTYFFAPDGPNAGARLRSPTVHLLPNFDEYLVAYKHHEPNYDEQRLGPRTSLGILRNILTLDGQVLGAWKRTVRKDDVLIEATPLVTLGAPERRDLERVANSYARFMGRPSAEVVTHKP